MHARDILLPEDEIVEWLEAMILPMAKLDHLDAKNQLAIENAWREIRSVGDNAVFMYWVEGETEERIMEFCLEYSLGSTEFVENWVKNWITHPMFHLYTFNYSCGYGLLDRLFSRTGDRRHWFNTLLKETYLPGEIERMGTR